MYCTVQPLERAHQRPFACQAGGNMKIRLVQLDVIPGQPAHNGRQMLAHIAQAQRDRIELLVFPEMSLPGYFLGDEWERSAFLRECEHWGEVIRKASQNITIIFGSIAVDWQNNNEDGRERKYNAVFVAEDGELLPHPVTGQKDQKSTRLKSSYVRS